jgi:hypothetical protein
MTRKAWVGLVVVVGVVVWCAWTAATDRGVVGGGRPPGMEEPRIARYLPLDQHGADNDLDMMYRAYLASYAAARGALYLDATDAWRSGPVCCGYALGAADAANGRDPQSVPEFMEQAAILLAVSDKEP